MEDKSDYYHGETVNNERPPPPPYSTESQPTSGPSYGPGAYSYGVSVVHAPVVTSVGMVGTNVGVVGTNVGVVGTNVGVVGTNVGVVGVGHGTVPVLVAQQVSPKPMNMTCKSCHASITTRVDQKATWKTHFFAGLLCLMGCWCCCCIPYCVDSCMNNDHYCPNCNAYIGTYIT